MAMSTSHEETPSASTPTETSPLLPPSCPQSSASSPDAEAGKLDKVKQHPMADKMHILLPAVGVGIYLVAIDQLLAVATYAKIGSELNALSRTSWIATAYFLALTSFQPLYGRLSDIFGRKECLLFAYAVFGLGCLGCGLAENMLQLCVARVIAGIGGGGMSSVVSILLSDIVPLRERGVWQGYLNVIYAAGTSTGAPIGGLLADSFGWRWSFMAQTPLCLAAWLAVYFVLDLEPVSHGNWLSKMRQIDFLGAFTLVLAVVALLTGLDSGSNLGWSHHITIIALSLTPLLFGLFLFVEMKVAAHPFAPGHIIFDRGMFPCYLVNMFGVAGQFGIIFFLPLYFQAIEGLSATASGSMLVPSMVASVFSSLGGGWVIKRTGRFYWPTVAGYAVMLLAMAPLAVSVWHRSLPGSLAGFVLSSIGCGCGITTVLIALLANAAPEDSAVVIACSYLFRSLGSSIGISVSSAVLQQVLRSQLAARMDGDEARHIERKVRQSLDIIKELPPVLAEQVRLSYRIATLGAFVPSLIFIFACFILTFWIREKALKK